MSGRVALPDGATIVVIGGGPAGSFFAIRALRKAREHGRRLDLLILEKEQELNFYESACPFASRGGCNYCAGGISPKLAEVLREDGLALPDGIVQGRTDRIVVHGDWKSIELTVPEGKEVLSVFRGSRPNKRLERYTNFDSYLLSRAVDEGARVITAEAREAHFSADGRPLIGYRVADGERVRDETVGADLAVFAGGVNQQMGKEAGSGRLFQMVEELIPDYRPPKVRQALISEMQGEEDDLRYMAGELHFAQYGSKDLRIEMSSLIPKERWMTVVLLGKSVDEARPTEYLEIVKGFLGLPHIRRLLPGEVNLKPVCLCHPNMTVGMARNPFGHRTAVIGDMAVSRLYKDGILSAYTTANALADCIFSSGVDRGSLKMFYRPTVADLHGDNRFGKMVFFVTREVFSRPILSRIFYQSLLTERRNKPRHKRRLAGVLWKISSGDETYRRIFAETLRPRTAWLIFAGGVLVTIRNYLTERLFGLEWGDFGRYPTGVPLEEVEKKRREIMTVLGLEPFTGQPEFERMYSIRMKADEKAVFRQLGKFGDEDRKYFKPRFVNVHRTVGGPNEVGSTVRYDVLLSRLSFNVVLEKVVAGRYLLYRVQGGFPRGGVLTFDIDRSRPGGGFLTIYVAFNFPTSRNPLKRLGWYLFKLAFPGYVHDVIWNHSLCELKHVAELDQE